MIISPAMRAAVGLWVVFAGLSVVLSECLEYVDLEPNQSTSVPDGWKRLEKVAEDERMMLTFALKQQNVEKLEYLFWRVSNPKDKLYGKHLKLAEIAAMVQPSKTTIAEVRKWLEKAGVTECSTIITKDFMNCSMTVREAQRLLGNVKFHRYTDGERTVIRSEVKYHVPKHLKDHLDFVGGVHRFPSGQRLKIKGIVDQDQVKSSQVNHSISSFRYGVHPDTLRKRYNVSDHVGSNPENSQATAQFLKQYYSATDLKEFMYFFGGGFPHLKEVSHVVGPNKGKAGLEANLDVQYIMSLGANISTTFWSTGGLHEKQEPFLVWLENLSNTSEVPPVFSVSYGDHERTLSDEYMRRINLEFQKIGVRGVSVLFASGDDGAGCHYFNDTAYTFEPDFPASSPYVTTIGGTEFTGIFSDIDEKGNDISGGGFSNVFPMPKYQMETVAGYLNTTKLPDPALFNPKNRAYPDVSAMSDDFWIIINKLLMNVAGTSAATPTVAGLIAMANDARLNAGKPALGFLNPFIYQNPQIFYDVTSGTPNQACWLEDLEGYNLAKGWDPVTGFGTPDYNRLIAAAMKY